MQRHLYKSDSAPLKSHGSQDFLAIMNGNTFQQGEGSHPGGYSPKIWAGRCDPLLETLTIYHTKICGFPYFRPDPKFKLIPYSRPNRLKKSQKDNYGCVKSLVARSFVLLHNLQCADKTKGNLA